MSPPSPANFYHLYADGAWEEPVREHLRALEVSEFDGQRFVGLVGSPGNRARVLTAMPGWKVVAEADTGFEQVTLQALHVWAGSAPPAAPVLYAHAKGSAFSADDPTAQRWRHAMVHETVMPWQVAATHLADHDAVGARWLEAPNRFFFGNYWWATAGYLASLPAPSSGTRFDAERWLGEGSPVVKDLCPEFEDKYNLGWDYYLKLHRTGRDCENCCLTYPPPGVRCGA